MVVRPSRNLCYAAAGWSYLVPGIPCHITLLTLLEHVPAARPCSDAADQALGLLQNGGAGELASSAFVSCNSTISALNTASLDVVSRFSCLGDTEDSAMGTG
jgi:hypothetical protein